MKAESAAVREVGDACEFPNGRDAVRWLLGDWRGMPRVRIDKNSFGVIELDRRKVADLVLFEVQPDTVVDAFHGADRNGDPLFAP